MNENIRIITSDQYEIYLQNKWFEYNNTLIRGSAYLGEKLLTEVELAKYIDSINIEKFNEFNKLNGYFVCIKRSDKDINIISDRVRTFPIFYILKQSKVYICDDPYILKERFSTGEYESISQKEILLLGYVTDENTLIKDINQTLPGQIISFSNGKKSVKSYFRFLGKHHHNNEGKRSLLRRHSLVLEDIFKRLINYAQGKTIVIPLSGGYDSRLIAVMLKKLNYENVIAFTYGKKDNPESIVSKSVADNLGFRWIFIPYTNEKTYKWYNSKEYKTFEKFADNLSGICLDREWPAIYELRKQKLIPEDSIIVPGHSGDMIAGYSLQSDWLTKEVYEDEMVDRILNNNYGMWNWDGSRREFRELFKMKIIKTTEIKDTNIDGNKTDFYEKWDWQERITKFVVNSVRIYDYFGYKWWLPLCDKEFIDFWFGVPNKFRREKSLYIHHGTSIYSKVANISYEKALVNFETVNNHNTFKIKVFNFIKNIIINTKFESVARRIYKKISLIQKQSMNERLDLQNRDNDWEQTTGRINEALYKELEPYITGRSSCKTLQKLGHIDFEKNHVSEDVVNMLIEMKG